MLTRRIQIGRPKRPTDPIRYRALPLSARMVVPIQYGPNVIPGRPQELFLVQGRFQVGPDSSTAPKYDVTPNGERFVFVQPNASSLANPSQSQINVVLNWFEELKERVPVP